MLLRRLKVLISQGGIDYDVYENWAIKSGEFGGILNNNFIQFKLNQSKLLQISLIVGTDVLVHTLMEFNKIVPLYSVFNYGTPILLLIFYQLYLVHNRLHYILQQDM
jgi:hypothetical protein